MREKVAVFGKANSLIGILTENSSIEYHTSLPVIIILNAGVLHRVGPNRIHVKIARKIADSGFKIFRFDFSGIGDSTRNNNNVSFEKNRVNEVREAIDYLVSVTGIRECILIGICSGADVAYQTACHDNRVVGFIGINGFYKNGNHDETIDDIVKMKTQIRYYKNRIVTFEGWKRMIKGKSNFQMIKKIIFHKMKGFLKQNNKLMTGKIISKDWQELVARKVDVLLIYSDGSSAFDIYNLFLKKEFNRLNSSEQINVDILQQTDHIFTLLWSQKILVEMVHDWLLNKKRNFIKNGINYE